MTCYQMTISMPLTATGRKEGEKRIIYSLRFFPVLFRLDLALFLLAIKPITKHKLSHTWQYYIWLLVILRFYCPFPLPSVLWRGCPLCENIDGPSAILPWSRTRAWNQLIMLHCYRQRSQYQRFPANP